MEIRLALVAVGITATETPKLTFRMTRGAYEVRIYIMVFWAGAWDTAIVVRRYSAIGTLHDFTDPSTVF